MNLSRITLPALLLAATMWAQVPSAQTPSKVIVAPIATVRVSPGSKSDVQMSFRVIPGYHINSNKPFSELLISTAINFDVPTNISLTGITYPKGENYTFAFSPGEKMSVYTGDFTVSGTVLTTHVTPKGTYRVHARLRYQACDNRACYPPAVVPFYFDVNVDKPKPVRKKGNPAQSPHIHK
jgi:hypothetical protein